MRRFARATSVEDLLAKGRDQRPSILDELKPYLHQRWNAGCNNVLQLHAEIQARRAARTTSSSPAPHRLIDVAAPPSGPGSVAAPG